LGFLPLQEIAVFLDKNSLSELQSTAFLDKRFAKVSHGKND
jgi:hypothetical protein